MFDLRIKQSDLDRLSEKQRTPKLKGRSKLKQLRLHLNEGITRGGFQTLNAIFKNGHFNKKENSNEMAILIDGLCVDLAEISQFKEWQTRLHSAKSEYAELKHQIEHIKKELTDLAQRIAGNGRNGRKLSNEMVAALMAERKELLKELLKEQETAIQRRFALADEIDDAKKNPMKDPKRDPSWDRRLVTSWSNVWDEWTDLSEYKNYV